MPQLLIYIAAFISAAWGISHLVPTKNVVAGFGDITSDNRNIIAMEWIIEGVALIFIGVLLAIVTYIDPASPVSRAVYAVSIIYLLSFALVSLSAVLVFIGIVMQL